MKLESKPQHRFNQDQVVKDFETMLGDESKSGTLRYNLASNSELYLSLIHI